MVDMVLRFRKLLYIQVALGVIAYAAARQSPTMLLVAGTLSALSWYIVEGPRGWPLPEWSINLGVVGAALWMFYAQFVLHRPLILNLGIFILCVQVFKLYQRKTNRDYAQLIVLSLMLMTCASIVSASMIHAVLLVPYLAVALLTIMHFQLKRGRDEVSEVDQAQAPPDHPRLPQPAALSREGRRRLRRAAVGCGVLAFALSAMTFVVMPRGERRNLLGDLEVTGKRSVSRFDNQVRLAGNTRVAGSEYPVLNVRMSRDGRSVGSQDRHFLLRGAALDTYNAEERRWQRGRGIADTDRKIGLRRDSAVSLVSSTPQRAPLVQKVTLRTDARGVLFSAYAPVRFSTDRLSSIHYSIYDQTLVAGHPFQGELGYTVRAVTDPTASAVERYEQSMIEERAVNWAAYARRPVSDSSRIERLTRSLLKKKGLSRDAQAVTAPQDARIAAVIEQYLRSNFQYTLDLPPIPAGTEPIVAFLFNQRRGHCEYFASGMCAMLRSIGIRSRVITGYRATDYNGMGGYYVVREKNAHAWVEAWAPGAGWRTYDPSPPAAIERIHDPGSGLLAFLHDTYEYLQHQWISKVITYDDQQRQSVMAGADSVVSGLVAVGKKLAAALWKWVRGIPERWTLGQWGYLFAGGIWLVISFAVFGLVKMLVNRWRSIRQLQLEGVSRGDQRRLAEHLRFYLRMLKILRRGGHDKPVWQPPASFAHRLTREDPERFADVLPLTDLFYEIRFGGRPLDGERSRKIRSHLEGLRRRVLRSPLRPA